MVNIYLLRKYNNYFNRIIKRELTISDYIANRDYDAFSVDFNPNDGVETKQIVNWSSDWIPDYLIVTTSTGEILHRWFVTEAVRTRGKQYELSLKRDVIADFKDEVLQSPAYIDKGIIRDGTNPLLLNNEGVNLNQIKVFEKPLYDRTKCPWLVMYLTKETLGTDTPITINLNNSSDIYEILSTPISQWIYYQFSQGTNFKVADQVQLRFRAWQSNNFTNQLAFVINNQRVASFENDYSDTNLRFGNHITILNDIRRYFGSGGGNLNSIINNAISTFSFKSQSDLENLMKYDGKMIKDSTGAFYDIKVTSIGSDTTTEVVSNNSTPSLFTEMNTAWNGATGATGVGNLSAFRVRFINSQNYIVEITPSTQISGATCNLQNATDTTNSPLYDIICMPYGEVSITSASTGRQCTTSASTSLAVMNSIARALTSAKVLDLQLLPYCPVQNDIVLDKTMVLFGTGHDYIEVIDGSSLISYIIVASRPTFSFNLYEGVNTPYYETDNAEAMNVKYLNDCTLLRLCSPNYNGLFDMNIAKNGGTINYFNVDCTYKPITPYIHVNPDFNYMYGHDYDDARGLICGGDFSLGILNDAWNAYEVQNKNYQAIFDRQIQNMEFNNAIQRVESGWGVASGTLGGAASGAVGGAMVGGGYGAIAGAVVGGATSLVGGIADTINLAKRQQEARNLSVDMYNLNLGNIKALPLSVTRTSAITANNKLVPFVEAYECTEVERNAYFNKLTYDGMTIGIIDTIGNWVVEGTTSYLKCRLIRNEEMSDDTHLFNAIYEELSKGVYL